MGKNKKRKKRFWAVLLLVCLCLGSCQVPVSAAKQTGTSAALTLNRTTATVLKGKAFRLTASVGGKAVSATWASSNPKVAIVTSTGAVKVTGCGTAYIYAKSRSGLTAWCKVTGVFYSKAGRTLSVWTPDGTRTYQCYTQNAYGLQSWGCVVTAVSIAVSGFGKNYTPRQIQSGSAKSFYSVRYAVKKMKASASLHGRAAISVRTAAQVLTDMGIKAKPVYRFTKAAALKQITDHVKQGKPVIIKADASRVGGIQIANSHHSLVLVGIDDAGYGIFIDPMTGAVNYAHVSRKYFKMKLSTMIAYFMKPASGNYAAPYVTSAKTAGGYILLG